MKRERTHKLVEMVFKGEIPGPVKLSDESIEIVRAASFAGDYAMVRDQDGKLRVLKEVRI